MDHDYLFKELLTTFFHEFVELFLPDVAVYLDRTFNVVPLRQEILNDISLGDVHKVDLLMKVKFKGEDAYFLIHVENQATAQADFPKRMFRYFARLSETHDLPVYPVVIFSYDAPERAEPTQYVVTFPDKTVLSFDYTVIQLNRLPWRDFIRTQNPVANALLAKMKIAPEDRPKARAEGLRMLASSRYDQARTRLIGLFIDRYLRLSAEELPQFEREMDGFAPAERQQTVEMLTSWELTGHEKGLERGLSEGRSQGLSQGLIQGLHEGMIKVITSQIRKQFGALPDDLNTRLARLSSEQLDDLSIALFDFTNVADLEQWLARQETGR